jgi:transposase
MDPANQLDRPSTSPTLSLSTPSSSAYPEHPSTPPPAPPPTTSHTTRDQRLQAQTLHDIGLSYAQIRAHLGLTFRQISYAIRHRLTPQKRSGRPPVLTQEEVVEIIDWVCALKGNRRTPWAKIPIILELNVGYHAARNALRKAGFSRRVARRKPPISERNRLVRL